MKKVMDWDVRPSQAKILMSKYTAESAPSLAYPVSFLMQDLDRRAFKVHSRDRGALLANGIHARLGGERLPVLRRSNPRQDRRCA